MDPFSYLSVLISIILGLGITQLVTGLGRLIQARARIKFYAKSLRLQSISNFVCVVELSLNDGHDRRLNRSKPRGKSAGEVLDHDRNKPLERSIDRSVQNDRSMWGIVFADICQIEPIGRQVVELNCPQLPLATNVVASLTGNSSFGARSSLRVH